MGVMTMDLNTMWQYIGELINQGIEWVGANYTAILATIGSAVGAGGISVVAFQVVRTVVPLLKNTNKPILSELGTFVANITPRIETIIEKMKSQETKLALIESENRTLKDYIALAAETNAKSVFLDEATKAQYAAFALALKSVPNAVVQSVGTQVEKAIEDGELTPTEMIEIAEKIPVVEKVLGTPIDAIISKGV